MTATAATAPVIEARPVPDRRRSGFLPHLFGAPYTLEGERAVYGWMKRLDETYSGGFWEFFQLSNGGGFMAPRPDRARRLVCSNYFEGDVSADAAGIVVTLYALNQMVCVAHERGAADPCGELLTEQYYRLRDFALAHPEQSAILAAID